MATESTKDMTAGPPRKLILGFSIPLLFGALFQQCYGVVDTIIVGRFLGVNALAGVGATGSLNFMVIGFCMGVCSGFAIPVAHKFGAKDFPGMRQVVANGVWLSLFFSIVMTAVVVSLCSSILVWMKTPEDIFSYSYSYILIIFLGIPATYLYNFLSGVIRSMGDSRTPVFFLILSSFLNIGLDFLFIVAFRMGVAGAAAATVASQLISGLLCLVYMVKKFEILHITRKKWKMDSLYIRLLCGMGIPMGLQYSITAVGSLVLQTSVNTLGTLAVAAVTAAGRVNMFFACPYETMGATMATYSGQNVGAKKLGHLGQGLKSCVLLGVSCAVLSFAAIYFFGEDLAALFVDSGDISVKKEILANAKLFLIINSAFYVALAMVNIFRLMIQGMGFSALSILAGVFEMVARTLVGIVLVPRAGFLGVCFSNPMAWMSATVFLIPAYFHVRRKLKLENGGD